MMDEYIKLSDYAKYLEIRKGDIIFVSSDTKKLLYDAIKHGEKVDLNLLIDGLIEEVGKGGTVVFPTYNWDFCDGKMFDYRTTPCKTGALGTKALQRGDFKRTKHPIYSFAVYGRYKDLLCDMSNIDSFGADSPFAFFRQYNAKNYIIDVTLKHCFTFAHFAEQQSGMVNYRYVKEFVADYVDENGTKSERNYSMFVRKLDLDVKTTIDPIEADFFKAGIEKEYKINNSEIKKIELEGAYNIMVNDIEHNNSRKLCSYIGQAVEGE